MALFLWGSSAWEYLSLHEEEGHACGMRARAPESRFRTAVPGKIEVEDALHNTLSGLTSPLHLVVGQHSSRRSLAGAVCHSWEGRLPDQAFWRAGRARAIYVSTPEFAFLQMAPRHTLVQLIALGFEACGTFWLTKRDVRGFGPRDVLTTPDALKRALCTMEAAPGIRAARRAAHLVVAGAASPMEAALVMLLCLPCSLGGYGLPCPSLNHAVETPLKYRERVRQQRFACDLFWDAACLDVEYDSSMFHAGPRDLVRDSIRRDALALLGISVITVTSGQIRDVDRLDEVARLIAKRLGCRIRSDRVPDWAWRRGELRKELLFSTAGAGA